MENYSFPDTDTLEVPDVASVRSSVPQPNVDADIQLLQQASFAEQKSNNVAYFPYAKNNAPIIAEILRNHPLYPVLTKEVQVPLLYAQQAWRSLEFHQDEGHFYFTAKVDHFTISFGLNKFRQVLGFPSANSRPDANDFEQFGSIEDALAGVRAIGYNATLANCSNFNKSNLPTTYNTLFTALSRSLTGKQRGTDTATQSMMIFFHGVLFNRHYDYAALIFHDMKELKAKAVRHLAYPRFLSILIASAMVRNLEIPRRVNAEKVRLFPMQSVRYPNKQFPIREIPLFDELLAYADPEVECVRVYRLQYAPMVQPKPAGPSQGAILRSEGIDSRDQVSRDLGQGEQRENTERGNGGAPSDQPAHSTGNVAVQIGRISSEVQMDNIFEAAKLEQVVNQVDPIIDQTTPILEEQEDKELVDYELSPLEEQTLDSFVQTDVVDESEPDAISLEAQQGDDPILYTTDAMSQRLHMLLGSESSEFSDSDDGLVGQRLDDVFGSSSSSEDTQLIIHGEVYDDTPVDAPTKGFSSLDADDEPMDDNQGSSLIAHQGDIRMEKGDLVENSDMRLSERDGEKHGESVTGARDIVQTPFQTESSRVATSSRGEHLLPSTIEIDMVHPTMHSTAPSSHSTISQQMVVSFSREDQAQLVPTTHLEFGGTDIVRQLPQPMTSFKSTSSLGPLVHNVYTHSLSRTPLVTSFAGCFSSSAGTSRVSSSFVGVLRGPGGNPISVNITPTLNMGTLSFTLGQTGSLSDPGVMLPDSLMTSLRQTSTILGSFSTVSTASVSSYGSQPTQSSTTSDVSQIVATVPVDNLITRTLFQANNKQIVDKMHEQTQEIAALKQQVATLVKGKAPVSESVSPPVKLPRPSSEDLPVPELKNILLAKLIDSGSTDDADLVQVLHRQAQLQQQAIQEQRSQSHLVTHTDLRNIQTSLDSSLTKMMQVFMDKLSQLSDRVRVVEETCQTAANRSSRKHDDHDDHDRHEGERKRKRFESSPDVNKDHLSHNVQIVDMFEERPPRETTKETS